MTGLLSRIKAARIDRIAQYRQKHAQAELESACMKMPEPACFAQAITNTSKTEWQIGVIAEIKKASPSFGLIRADFDLKCIVDSYVSVGVSCLSVLTEEDHFKGSYKNLEYAAKHALLPCLCKDFMIDPYQIYYARAHGASCILLIVRMLSDIELESFFALATQLDMGCLFEVHDGEDLDRALAHKPNLIGINNRNLNTLEIDLKTTSRLRDRITSDCLVVSESGIHSKEQLTELRKASIDAILIGEALMRKPDPGAYLKELVGAGD